MKWLVSLFWRNFQIVLGNSSMDFVNVTYKNVEGGIIRILRRLSSFWWEERWTNPAKNWTYSKVRICGLWRQESEFLASWSIKLPTYPVSIQSAGSSSPKFNVVFIFFLPPPKFFYGSKLILVVNGRAPPCSLSPTGWKFWADGRWGLSASYRWWAVLSNRTNAD